MAIDINTAGFEDWQMRVVAEYDDVSVRTERLASFIGTDRFKALEREDQVLLREQFASMNRYCQALENRLRRFEAAASPDEPVLVFWEQRPSDGDPLAQRATRAAIPVRRAAGFTIPHTDCNQHLVTCSRREAIETYEARLL